MLLKIAAGFAAIPVLAVGVVAGTGVVVVDVKDDGHRIVVPMPLLLARGAAAFVPADKVHLDTPDLREHLALAGKLADALREVPDAELVRVDDRDEHVSIAKSGDMLTVKVDSHDERVRVQVPIAMLTDVLRSCDGKRVDLGGLVGALGHARFTDLVLVEGRNGERVKVSVY